MRQTKAVQVKLGSIEVLLSPLAFEPEGEVELDTPGNNAENIDDLLYIKRPKPTERI